MQYNVLFTNIFLVLSKHFYNTKKGSDFAGTKESLCVTLYFAVKTDYIVGLVQVLDTNPLYFYSNSD